MRAGQSLSTNEMLKFHLDHALARDAIHATWNFEHMMRECENKNISTHFVRTQALSRKEYLLNPPSGCCVHDDDVKILAEKNETYDLALIVTDGLSSLAVEAHFLPFLDSFFSVIAKKKLKCSPIIFAPYGRVALSDHLGMLLRSKIAIIFVGERPGLSAADSMGIYLTYDPKIGRVNSERNCISNIRPPFGLSYAEAATQLFNLIEKCLEKKCSGIIANNKYICS